MSGYRCVSGYRCRCSCRCCHSCLFRRFDPAARCSRLGRGVDRGGGRHLGVPTREGRKLVFIHLQGAVQGQSDGVATKAAHCDLEVLGWLTQDARLGHDRASSLPSRNIHNPGKTASAKKTPLVTVQNDASTVLTHLPQAVQHTRARQGLCPTCNMWLGYHNLHLPTCHSLLLLLLPVQLPALPDNSRTSSIRTVDIMQYSKAVYLKP